MAREEQAMSAERLAEIRRVSDRFNGEAGSYAGSSHHPTRDSAMLGHAMPDMLAEVERLRAALAAAAAREAALVAVVRAVGEEDHEYPDMTPGQTRYLCPFCPGNDAATRMAFVHARWCPVTQARALLASADEQGEA